MKSKERHHLKENDFAVHAARVADVTREHGRSMAIGLGAVALVAVLVTGFFMWRGRQADAAGALLGKAVGISQSRDRTPVESAWGQAGAWHLFDRGRSRPGRVRGVRGGRDDISGNRCRTGRALPGRGGLLVLQRYDDAATRFQQVVADAGSSIYGSMAALGLAEAQSASGKYDEAIAAYTDPLG